MAECCGIDHSIGEYTEQQRADLDLVLAFNRTMASAIDGCRDVSAVEALLDPDPLRYMWVDEGAGRLPAFVGAATRALTDAPALEGHVRAPGDTVWSSGTAARPAVAATPFGAVLHAWLEWREGDGDQVLALLCAPGEPAGEPVVLSGPPADCFRPTAVFDAAGRAWVLWSRSDDGVVTVWCRRHEDGAWTPEEQVARTEHPSFNQECVAHADGSVEVVWQAPLGQRFGITSRRWRAGSWDEPRLVSGAADGDGAAANVWDPSVAALPDGGTAYAWCEYAAGSYRVVERRAAADGSLAPARALTGGTDYALHPSLAVTPSGDVWCAFDVITVAGHGGSGPTRLRPTAEVGPDTRLPGTRASGEAVPAELLPEVSASIRVVRVADDGLHEAEGTLAPGLDVVPGGLPRLVSDASGSLVLAYRVHRRLPLMTYYWEVATQVLGPTGWSPPTTYGGSDGTLEEPALAPLPDGAVLAWQTDGRLERGLTWTEGFGGRECPVLLEHHGEVVWHGMHGTGSVRGATVPAPARQPRPSAPGTWCAATSAARPARGRAPTAPATRRPSTAQELRLYWGDLHRHSLISRCTSGDEPSLEDFYRYSWDVCEYDFWAVTDHSENSTAYQWWSIKKVADLFQVDGRFVPFYGFEWTGLMGHQNVIYGDVGRDAPIFSAYAAGSDTPDQLWAGLAAHGEHPAITIPHHPGSAMVPYDWGYGDERFLRVVEVFQACRGNYEDDGCFRQYSDGTLPGTFVLDGLRRGQRFGFLASSDHGHGAAYVGAYAASLDRASVFDALQRRRVFAATQRDVSSTCGSRTAAAAAPSWARRSCSPGRSSSPRTSAGTASSPASTSSATASSSTASCPTSTCRRAGSPSRCASSGGRATSRPTGAGGCRSPAAPCCRRLLEHRRHRHRRGERAVVVDDQELRVTRTARQRGGVELTVLGPPDAQVEVVGAGSARCGSRSATSSGRVVPVPLRGPGRMTLQPGAGGLAGMGTSERTVTWTDPVGGPGLLLRARLPDRRRDGLVVAGLGRPAGLRAWRAGVAAPPGSPRLARAEAGARGAGPGGRPGRVMEFVPVRTRAGGQQLHDRRLRTVLRPAAPRRPRRPPGDCCPDTRVSTSTDRPVAVRPPRRRPPASRDHPATFPRPPRPPGVCVPGHARVADTDRRVVGPAPPVSDAGRPRGGARAAAAGPPGTRRAAARARARSGCPPRPRRRRPPRRAAPA